MLLKHFTRLAISLALLCLPLAARQAQDAAQEPPAHVTLQGSVRTADGVAVPGASIHILEENSGKSWVTWTDDQGKFRLPELPGGKFKVDASQIGFGTATVELTPTSEKSPDIVLSLHIATAAEIAAANTAATTPTAPATAENKPSNPPTGAAANTTPPATGTAQATGDKTAPPANTQAARNGGRGQQGQQGGRGGGRGFNQVGVNGNGNADTTSNNGAAADEGGILGGNNDSADALLVAGTTAQGVQGGFPGGLQGMGGGGFDNPGGAPGGGFPGGGGDAGNTIPGMTGIPGGGGGIPGAGGAGAGGGGGGRGGPGGGGGGGGRGGPGGRGGRGGQNGPTSLYGMSRLMRQRINQMHYTLNETLYDSAFDARPWFASQSAGETAPPKVAFNNNRFGGSVGGPLRIPKIYDGRDKTYFFVNVQIGHGDTGVTNFGNVPTAAEATGDFCAAGTGGAAIQLYNYTSNFNGARSLLPIPGGCDLAGATNPSTGMPYISPVAAKLAALIPSPNLTGNPNYNYFLQGTTPTNTQAINTRLNQTLTPKLNFGVVYNISQNQSSGLGLFPSETSTTAGRGQNVTLTLNHNISTRLINSIALNFTRQRTVAQNAFANVTNEESLLGIAQGPGEAASNPLDWGLPGIVFNATGGVAFSGFSDVNPSLHKNETWNLTDTLSYILPKHTLHFGFTFRRIQLNSLADPDPRGQFNFSGLMTENLEPNPNNAAVEQAVPGTGSPLADFLLGLPGSTALRYSGVSDYLRTHGFIAYVNDDWHLKPHLTVTLGLRYELVYPSSELFGRLSNLDINPQNFLQTDVVTPCSSLSQAVSPCGVGQFSGPLPTTLIRPNYKNVAPRFGFAWRVPGKFFDANNGRHYLTVRGGYSIFDISSAYNTLDTYMLNQFPFATSTSATTSLANVLTLQNGFPTGTTSFNTLAVSPNYHNPYVQIWNLGIESQIVDGLVYSLTYIGTKGTHLDQLTAPNVLSTTSPALTGASILQQDAYTYDISGGNSIYNALQARLQKRMRNGFTYTILYTYAKSIDDSSSIGGSSQTLVQEFPLFNLERGLSAFDIRHSITGNSTYELPFGQRKKWAHSGVEARLLSNFRLSGSVTYHTGTPITPNVTGQLTNYATGNFQTRPDVLPGCNINLPSGQRSVTEFFNTSCFAIPGTDFPGTSMVAPGNLFGDSGRDTIEGPGMFVVNLALQRTITLDRDGQRHLDLRWEVNNVGNHPNWSGISLVDGPTNFGRVNGASSMRTMDAVIRLNF
jgi:hypothetical protein